MNMPKVCRSLQAHAKEELQLVFEIFHHQADHRQLAPQSFAAEQQVSMGEPRVSVFSIVLDVTH